jgi:hypothetical protein
MSTTKTNENPWPPLADAIGSAKPCSLKARKHLPWAVSELEKMEKEEADPKLRALWRNAAQLGREAISPNYLFRRKEFGLSAYWPRNAELLATALLML